MKKLAPIAALLLSGCAFPVINTELPPGWKSAQRYGTGTHLSPSWADANVKYMNADSVRELQRDRIGSKEVPKL